MKIKIRYENEYQTLEVENVELERWLNISISENESQEDYEKRIQDVIEERFNRPDYNCWHKHDRHTGNAYMKSKDGTVEVNTEEAIMYRAADKSAFNSSIDGVHTMTLFYRTRTQFLFEKLDGFEDNFSNLIRAINTRYPECATRQGSQYIMDLSFKKISNVDDIEKLVKVLDFVMSVIKVIM